MRAKEILFLPARAFGKDRWELYDLAKDPGERIDLAEENPEKLDELLQHWDTYVKETGTVWRHGPGGVVNPVDPKRKGSGIAFGPVPEDTVGGDPVAQCTAWMSVGEGQKARESVPHYGMQ